VTLKIDCEKKTYYPGITKIGKQRYRLRVYFRDWGTGKERQYSRVFEGTLDEAVVERAQLLTHRNQTGKPERRRLNDYDESWLKHKAILVRPSTAERLACQVGHHIESILGEFWVDAIIPVDIRSWQAELRSTGLAPATINSAHRTIRSILDSAVADGLIESNPAKLVPMLREGRTKGARGTVLTPDQLGKFISTGDMLVHNEKIAPDLFAMIVVLALCGTRFGELAASTWSDLRDGLLYIERAVWNRNVDTTKTDDPRVVLVPSLALEQLQAQRQRLVAEQHPALSMGLMFPNTPQDAKIGATRRKSETLNWYRYPSALTPCYKLICSEAGLPQITSHSLRRAWDRWTRWAGVDHMARRAMAGWRTETAHAIYSEVDPEEARPAMESAQRRIMGEEI
jgi:integrase